MRTRRLALLAPAIGLVAALLVACSKPPTAAMDAARKAFAAAALAKRCASEAYRSAEAMLKKAEDLVKQKKYEQAKEAATQAELLAKKARELAEANRAVCDKIAVAETPAKKEEPPPQTGPVTTPTAPVTGTTTVTDLGADKVTVYFDYNKDDVRAEYHAALSALAQKARSNTSVRFVIEGHCDARGSTEYNLALGERRARAVKKYLIGQGMEDRQIVLVSYGSERPAVEASTEEAHAKNRRAVVLPR